MPNPLYLVGCASGIAGANLHSGEGPLVMQKSPYLSDLAVQWEKVIHAPRLDTALRLDESVSQLCTELAQTVSALARQKQWFSVLGGDHSCAIGTWSGVYDALHDQGDIGLIWIDAHMDSHTPETSESGRIHGMPLASLMGYGYGTLTSILHHAPKLKPEHVCLIGVRSFE
ncbi:MAG: arginase, partial [Gammaproteobacteria bacterium]